MKRLVAMTMLVVAALTLIGCSTIDNINPWSDPKAIKIDKPISMPLFYVRTVALSAEQKNHVLPTYIDQRYGQQVLQAGTVDTTWVYLQKNANQRKECRDKVKATCRSGEQPAMTFLISTKDCAGPLSGFPNVTDAQIEEAKVMIREVVEDGIAVFCCLYVDDPSGSMPNWTKIEQHKAVWTKINNGIGRYVTAYVLSIESNELASDATHLKNCINVMKAAMPGAYYYGTHMAFHGTGRYVWVGGPTTPSSADFILLEAPWHPNQGNAQGMNGIKELYNSVKPRVGGLRLIWHEYNLDPDGNMNKQQRDWLKDKKIEWGVG